MITTDSLRVDVNRVVEVVCKFISEKVSVSKADGVVLGLSGGMDSATLAFLCSKSLGGEKVLALILPSKVTSEEDVKDAVEVAEKAGVRHEVISIQEVIDCFSRVLRASESDVLPLGNLAVRVRMCTLYYYACLLYTSPSPRDRG